MAADLLSRKTRLWIHATSLGGVESSLERRRRWKAEAATIPEGLVRLSVGIEDVEDLWEDLRAALTGASADRASSQAWASQCSSGLVSRAMKEFIMSSAVILPSTTASTASAIGASTPMRRASSSRDLQDFAPSATWRVEA